MKVGTSAKFALILVTVLSLVSCTAVLQRKGLIADPINVSGRKRFLKSGGGLYLDSMPVMLVVRPAAVEHVLMAGPLLPVFPWPPGIYQSYQHRHQSEVREGDLSIVLIFERDRLQSQRFTFDPTAISLESPSQRVVSSGITCDIQTALGGCHEISKNAFEINVSTNVNLGLWATISFKYPAHDAINAVLNLGTILMNGKPVSEPPFRIVQYKQIESAP